MTEAPVVLYSVKEYAVLRGVSARTVRDWIRRDWVDAERTAGEHGQWRIRVRVYTDHSAAS